MFTRQLITLCLAAGLAPAPESSTLVYNSTARWAGTAIPMRAGSNSFPTGSPWTTALTTAVARFSINPSACYINLTLGDTSCGLNNGQSEIWFTDDFDGLAEAHRYYDSAGNIDEADVIFYPTWDDGDDYDDFTVSLYKGDVHAYGGIYRPFQATALHELTHAAGLSHEADEYNLMGNAFTHLASNGVDCVAYVGEDASDGLISLYGRTSYTFEDVGVTIMRYDGPSGEYSTHAHGKVRTTAGVEVSSSSTIFGQKVYNVTKGTAYRFEFTFENNGETTQNPHVGFYRSTSSSSSAGDVLLAGRTLGLGRNDVYEIDQSITIPSALTSGSLWYIKAVIDDNNAIAETDGTNNTAYHMVRVN